MAVSDERLSAAMPGRATGLRAGYAGWLLAILALLTLLRILSLAKADFGLLTDEAQYWAWAQHPGWGYFSKPPLIAWLIWGTTALFGDAAWAVRLPAPLLHAGTALLLYGLAARLYDRRIAFWSALGFATLPGVSFSAILMTTDVPLLFFWAAALCSLERLIATRRTGWAVGLGLALGLGLLAKYAAVYFLPCVLLYAVTAQPARWLLRSPKSLIFLGLAGLLVLPNLLWNAENGFVTARHIAGDAGWSGIPFHIDQAGAFLASQFAVFGPIPMAALLWLAVRWPARPVDRRMRFLLCFSLPVIGLMLGQALAADAHANWAAPAYCAGAVAVTAWLLQPGRQRWLAASAALHAGLALLLCVMVGLVHGPVLPQSLDPFHRGRGWDRLAAAVAESYAAGGYTAVLSESRTTVAELTYELRGTGIPVVTWREGDLPDNAFQMTALPTARQARAVLWVTEKPDQPGLDPPFTDAAIVRTVDIPAARDRTRHFAFAALPPLPIR